MVSLPGRAGTFNKVGGRKRPATCIADEQEVIRYLFTIPKGTEYKSMFCRCSKITAELFDSASLINISLS